LDRQEYTGDTVNFRTSKQSFKQKKRTENPREEWKVFPDTHPAIIDRETFALVQELRQHRRRPSKSGEVSMFSGLLYCADCGEKLYYACTNNYKREQAYFFCSSYRRVTSLCSAHYIRECVVEQLVLESLQRVFWYVQIFEEQFAKEQMERFGIQRKKEQDDERRELDRAWSRVTEIDRLIQKIYEDNANGKLSDERFATMAMAYENEQRELKARIPVLENSLSVAVSKGDDLKKFIDRVKEITRLTELTPEIVHEFIEKIVVSKPEKVDGKRHQQVDIYYKTIGLWCAPGPEELDGMYRERLKKICAEEKRKTA